jgi:hypothetical protein
MNLCGIDWGFVGIWAQVVAIAATGGLAVWVANRQLTAYNEQLRAFNDNERMRTSLKVLDDLYQRVPMRQYSVSPYEAISQVQGIADDPATLAHYREEAQAAANRTLTMPQLEQHDGRRINGVIASNYFVTMADLLQRNLVDEKFILEKLCTLIFRTYDGVIAMGDLATSANLRSFASLASKARAFDAAERAFDPATPES